MDSFSPHRRPEVEEMADKAYEVFDEHSAVDVALFMGRAVGKTVGELARQMSDQSSRRGQDGAVEEEILRRVENVEDDLRSTLIDGIA